MNFFLTSEQKIILTGTGPVPAAFAQSMGNGFLALACMPPPDRPDPVWTFFRTWIRNVLQDALRRNTLPEAEWYDLQNLADSAPALNRGAELTVSLAEEILHSLKDVLMEKISAEHTDIRGILTALVPEWKNVGRIMFHLAENKKDTDGKHPFVFLATYPNHSGEDGEIRHIPLSAAVKQYAKDRTALENMLSPVRRAAAGSPFLDAMMKDGSLFKPCLWSPREAFLFVRSFEICRQAGIPVRLNRTENRPSQLKLLITAEAAPRQKGVPLSQTILRFSARAAAGDRELTKEELDAIMSTGGGLIRIKGEWIEADTEKIKSLLEDWERAETLSDMADVPFFAGLRILAGMKRNGTKRDAGGNSADAGSMPDMPDMPEEYCDLRPGSSLRDLLDGMEIPPAPPIQPSLPLRPYQIEGVKWLWKMGELGIGGCLADDMGLGKTLQILSYLELLRRHGKLEQIPALVIAPASLLNNWASEAAKFVPEIKVCILHPSAMTVELFRHTPKEFLQTADLVITSYGMTVRLTQELTAFTFPVIILDEAQNIKNSLCRQSSVVRDLKGQRKFALTGTPVENSPLDLWSIFDFLTPGFLGQYHPFCESLKAMERGKDGHCDYSPLRRLIRPCILRRLKTDRSIIRDLPDKSEMRTWCFLSDVQLKLYQRVVNQFRAELETADDNRRKGVILSFLMQFKQICNHPTQFTGLGEYSRERSGKFQCLTDLAERAVSQGGRLLVFTQFKEIIQPIHDLLESVCGRPGLMLHGGTPVADRARFVEEFQRPDGPPFFVLSLRAAGTGLNLTAASHVIHFDRWWNPAVENQATDRAYRIGQHRNVLVYKFVCKGTLEEKIDSLIAGKSRLADDLLSGNSEKLLTAMSNDELMQFVKIDLPSNDTHNF